MHDRSTHKPNWPRDCPPPLREALEQYCARRAFVRRGKMLAAVAGGALVLFLAGTVLDRLLDVGSYVRLIPLILFGGVCVYGLLRIGLDVFWGRTDAEQLAGQMDRLLPGSRDTLRSAVNFLRHVEAGDQKGRPFLIRRTVDSAAALGEECDPADLVPRRGLWRWLGLAGLLMLVVAGCWAYDGMPMGLLARRFFHPFGNYPRPSWTRIKTDAPMTGRVEAGSDLTVRAELSGHVPQDPTCFLIVVPDDPARPQRRLTMQPLPGGGFRARLRNLQRSFRFYLRAGDGRSAARTVQVLHPPGIRSLVAQYDPPRYSRQERWTEEVKYRELKALSGTSVTGRFKTDRVVEQATVRLELTPSRGEESASEGAAGGPPLPMDRIRELRAKQEAKDKPATVTREVPVSLAGDGRSGEFHFRLRRSGRMRIVLTGPEGVSNRFAPGYKLTAVPDEPPTVTVTNLPENVTIRRDDVLRVQYQCRDDLGLADLQYRAVPPRNKHNEQMEFVPLEEFGVREAGGEITIPVRELAPLSPYTPAGGQGDVVLDFTLAATDLKGQTAHSRRMRLTVLTDTYDRQMREVTRHLREYLEVTERNLRRLRRGLNSLIVLQDAVGEGGEWGEFHQKKLEQTTHRLELTGWNSHNARQRARAYRFSLYPHRVQRAADHLLSYLQFQSGKYRALTKLGETKHPAGQLARAIEVLKQQVRFAESLGGAIRGTLRSADYDVVLYLLVLTRRDLARGEGERSELQKEKLASRGVRMADLLERLAETDAGQIPDEIAADIRSAASQYEVEELGSALDRAGSVLLTEDNLRLSANDAFSRFRETHGDEWLAGQASRRAELGIGPPAAQVLRTAWAERLILKRDGRLTNTARMAGEAVGYLRALGGEKEADALLEPARELADAVRLGGMSQQLTAACEEGAALLAGIESGRFDPGDARALGTWARFRDLVLALMESVPADESEVDAVREKLIRLGSYRSLAARWDLVALHRDDWAEFGELLALLRDLRRQVGVELAGAEVPANKLLAEACGRLAEIVRRERQGAIEYRQRIRRRIEEGIPAEPPEGEAPPADFERLWDYGVAQEKLLRRLSIAHRKILDLWESRRIAAGRPAPATTQVAMVRYVWWLRNQVATSFGRVLVRKRGRHGWEAQHNRTGDYPERLARAGAGFDALASGPTQESPAIEAVIKASRSRLDLEQEAERLREFTTTLRRLRSEDSGRGADQIRQLFRDRITGAFVAEAMATPLRRCERAFRRDRPLHSLGEEVRAGLERTGRLLAVLEDQFGDLGDARWAVDALAKAVGPNADEPEEDTKEEILRATGTLLESLAPRITLPEIRTDLPKWLDRAAGIHDLIYHCRVRTNRLWQVEAERQRRYFERERVRALLACFFGRAGPEDWRPMAAQFARYRIAERTSQGTSRESGGTLDVMVEGVQVDRLRMPKYLYEELMRARKQPYPAQFKDPALRYIQDLVEDAKR